MKNIHNFSKMRVISIILVVIFILFIVTILIFVSKPKGTFYKAIETGDIEAVKRMIAKNNAIVNKEIGSFTPLNHAIRYGQFEIIKFLVDNGADLSIRNGRHNSPVLNLPAIKGDLKSIKLLLKHGADIDATNMFLETPLMMAAKNCQEEAIKLLIDNGANKKSKSDSVSGYKTAKDFAFESNCSDEIQKLLGQ